MNLLLSHNYGVKRYLKKGVVLKCLVCKKQIYSKPSTIGRKKYCSKTCFFKAKPPKPKTGKWERCSHCKKSVWVFPRNFKRKYHFCSKNCLNGHSFIDKKELKCKFCKNKYFVHYSYLKLRTSKFCSMICCRTFKKMKFYQNKKKKKTDIAVLKKLLWGIFSQYIRQRDEGVCISCGKIEFWRKMDAGHYIPKTAGLSLYFDEKNVNAQCTYCNRWMHGNLSKYALALRKKYGENILEELDIKRSNFRKINSLEYKQMIEKYKQKLANILRN